MANCQPLRSTVTYRQGRSLSVHAEGHRSYCLQFWGCSLWTLSITSASRVVLRGVCQFSKDTIYALPTSGPLQVCLLICPKSHSLSLLFYLKHHFWGIPLNYIVCVCACMCVCVGICVPFVTDKCIFPLQTSLLLFIYVHLPPCARSVEHVAGSAHGTGSQH